MSTSITLPASDIATVSVKTGEVPSIITRNRGLNLLLANDLVLLAYVIASIGTEMGEGISGEICGTISIADSVIETIVIEYFNTTGAPVNLNSLNDVEIISPGNGDQLTFINGNWTNNSHGVDSSLNATFAQNTEMVQENIGHETQSLSNVIEVQTIFLSGFAYYTSLQSEFITQMTYQNALDLGLPTYNYFSPDSKRRTVFDIDFTESPAVSLDIKARVGEYFHFLIAKDGDTEWTILRNGYIDNSHGNRTVTIQAHEWPNTTGKNYVQIATGHNNNGSGVLQSGTIRRTTNELVVSEVVYDLNSFTIDGERVQPNSVRGLVISSTNYGYTDTSTPYVSFYNQVRVDDSPFMLLNGTVSLNTNDDGGVITNSTVHLGGGSKVVKVIVNLPAGVDIPITTTDITPNSFRVVGLLMDENNIGLTPDTQSTYIQGSFDDAVPNITGMIDETLLSHSTFKIWNSSDPSVTDISTGNTYSTWADILPLKPNFNTFRTEITFRNTSVDGVNTYTARGSVFINWVAGTIDGKVTQYDDNTNALIGSNVFKGIVGETVNLRPIANGRLAGDDSLVSAISTTSRTITGLPVAVTAGGTPHKVEYDIRHYNTLNNSSQEVETFKGIIPSGATEVMHGLGVLPDMVQCNIDGVNITTGFIDDTLGDHVQPIISYTDTHIYVNDTVSLPAEDIQVSAIKYTYNNLNT
jgi:hypothetical protein